MLPYKKTTKFSEVIREYPDTPQFLISINPKYNLLKNPVVVQLMSPRIDLNHVAARGGYTFEEFIAYIEEGILKGALKKSEAPVKSLEEATKLKDEIKSMIKQLKDKEDISKIKSHFKELLKKADPVLIAVAEGELTQEGYTVQDLMNACDVHLEIFKEQLQQSKVKVSSTHPLYRLIKDHDAILFYFEKGLKIAREMQKLESYDDAKDSINELKSIMTKLKETENHDVRQENTLFPILEKYGIEEPPAIMWEEHSRMKNTRASIEKVLVEEPKTKSYEEFVKFLNGAFLYLTETFTSHTQKEQQILYNVALDILSDQDWKDIQEESDKIGYFKLPEEVLNE